MNTSRPAWPPDDLTFAERELRLEFPSVGSEQVNRAVHSAAPFVLPDAGRVQLVRKAREFLRL